MTTLINASFFRRQPGAPRATSMGSRPRRRVSASVASVALLLASLAGAGCRSQPASAGTGDAPPAATAGSGVEAPPTDEADAAQAASTCFAEVTGVLASDEMEGRGVGTAGLAQAADFIEARMDELGLEAPEGGHRQTFEVVTGVGLGPDNALTSQLAGSPEGALLTLGDDYVPVGFSSSQAFAGELVFAGYGIRAEALDYDDYEGLDVEGKVVLVLRFEPGERDEASPFDGRRPTRWSDRRYKAMLAREAGAAALIFVSPPEPDSDGGEAETEAAARPESLPVLRREGPVSEAGIPVLHVTREVAQGWLASAGLDLLELQAAIDSDYTPRSQPVPGVHLSGRVDLSRTRAPVANVLGVLAGRGALASEVVVVGAHYDHLGRGGEGSRAPDSQEVHNGADDNASGVAAMLCAIPELEAAVAAESGPRRTLLVIAFTAEELGLGGSSWYVQHPAFPLEQTVAMVNLDMVGRVRENALSALGSDSAEEWSALLTRAAEPLGLAVEMGGDGYGPSDQMSFYSRGVPVVHLFSGTHEEYHTPQDDVETLNMAGGGRVAQLLSGLAAELLTRESAPTYVASTGGSTLEGDSRGYGAYLGTIPDYTAMTGAGEGGVLLSDVRSGGPADEAGIAGGDVIVEMAGVEIRNLYDMTFVLRDHRPGETIEVVVLRGGEPHRLAATLGRRGQPQGESPHGESGHSPAEGEGHRGEAAQRAETQPSWVPSAGRAADDLRDPREVHLADLRQLTFGGENAEAYWSPDGRRLIFQATPGDAEEGACDQQYELDLDTGEVTQISSGRGRTTCGYYSYPDGERVIYATTEHIDPACPPPPDFSQGYVWALYDFDLVWQDWPGHDPEPFLPSPGYDAEATVCMVDGRVIFTSTRNGDLDLYTVAPDGSDLRQLTHELGYDGGAFFTPDCRAVVWRASRPTTEEELSDYQQLLETGLIRPGALEIFVMDYPDGEPRQLTATGRANFAPYPLPDASAVIYSSNAGSASPREFDLWMVPWEGGEPERVTYTEQFDGFPMFSPDGRWLVFASNRGGSGGETNLFLARWVP